MCSTLKYLLIILFDKLILERPFHTPIESINPLADEANGCTEDPWDFEVSINSF